MENQLIDVLELLVEAAYSKKKKDLLLQANTGLEKFRFLARLAKDLKFINIRRFEYLSVNVNEVGSMLGGWIKQQSNYETA